jgi:hypothetical protein
LKNRRLFILASTADEGASRIIGWLRKQYGVPIEFVPFQFFTDEEGILLETERIPTEPITRQKGWDGDWFFNTNETHTKGAYQHMISKSVIALFGYDPGKGEAKLRRPSEGDWVFAYVNQKGIIAAGTILDDGPAPGIGVFGEGAKHEFHRRVKWDYITDVSNAINNSTVSGWGYNLPVRETICKIYDPVIAQRLRQELARRATKKSQ